MAKLPKSKRKAYISMLVRNMPIEFVIFFEEAIEGISEKEIEKQIGTMSSNQWRNCLELSLNNLILGEN